MTRASKNLKKRKTQNNSLLFLSHKAIELYQAQKDHRKEEVQSEWIGYLKASWNCHHDLRTSVKAFLRHKRNYSAQRHLVWVFHPRSKESVRIVLFPIAQKELQNTITKVTYARKHRHRSIHRQSIQKVTSKPLQGTSLRLRKTFPYKTRNLISTLLNSWKLENIKFFNQFFLMLT